MVSIKSINVQSDSLIKLSTNLLVLAQKEGGSLTGLDSGLNDIVSSAIAMESFTGKSGKTVNIYGDGTTKRVSVFGLGEDDKLTSDGIRALASKISAYANSLKLESFSVDGDSFGLNGADFAQAFAEGLVLGAYEFLDYKSKKKDANTLNTVNILGKVDASSIAKGEVIANGVAYARDLGNHPANQMTPSILAKNAEEIAKSSGMKATIFDVSEFQKMGLGSFYGVAQGSVGRVPAKMIIVEYNGGKKGDKPFALVGKGVTFDSGGISIKPSPNMGDMKYDMCGSAAVMGLLKTVAELKPALNIIFAIGATENMPDGNAQRPGDIVTAYNGKTIEVLNTDAEGRLVLADVLSYVNDKFSPVAMLDFATLTGAVLVALGDKATGLLGNNEDLMNEVKASSKATGERAWELPLWDEYTDDIKSDFADIKNIGKGRLAGTITAASFLKEFVGDTPWVHFDIAGTAWGPKKPAYQPKIGSTGVAVRLVYNLLENRVN